MSDINQDYLYPLWGSELKDYQFDVTHNAMHFKLLSVNKEGETHTQIDIYNIRMFCFGDYSCYEDRACGEDGGSFPNSEFDGDWNEFTEIETAQPGQANVKVFFDYSATYPSSNKVPSPYFNADQNIVINFPDAILTISAEILVINGKRFRWNQAQRTFVLEGETQCKALEVENAEPVTISYKNFTGLAASEHEKNGFRNDVVVTVGARKYELFITTMTRLQGEFKYLHDFHGYNSPVRNMVTVQKCTTEEIEYTVKKLVQDGYFNDDAGYFFPAG